MCAKSELTMSAVALRIVYIFDDGDTSDLALGTIDQSGMITVSKIQDGQEERVHQLVDELNESDKVYIKRGSDSNSRGLQKIPIYRGDERFIETLCETARRFYSVDLQFSKEDLTAPDRDLGLSIVAATRTTALSTSSAPLPSQQQQ
jgi:hypothetical protein